MSTGTWSTRRRSSRCSRRLIGCRVSTWAAARGHNTRLLAAKGARIVALDIAESFVAAAVEAGTHALAGAVVTFDALHTVRANLNWLAGDKKAPTSPS
jgi:hypothetical protein